jgi:hypothetical protein
MKYLIIKIIGNKLYTLLCSRCGLSSDKLPTKNGKNELKLFLGGLFIFYITLVSFSIPKTAPIANAPVTTFFIGVQTNGVLPDFCVLPLEVSLPLLSCPIGIALPVVATGIMICEPLPPKPIRIAPLSKKLGGSEVKVLGTILPSIVSPFLKDLRIGIYEQGGFDFEHSGAGEVQLKLVVKTNFAISNFFSNVWHKDTTNFLIFFNFKKVEERWQKSFNSFLLPLKFIRSENGAMEHNKTLYVCFTN